MDLAMQTQEEGGLVFSRQTYRSGTVLSAHTHPLSYLSFVGSGAYREKVGKKVRDCVPATILLHPAGETHENFFYGAEVELLRIEAADSKLFELIDGRDFSRSKSTTL